MVFVKWSEISIRTTNEAIEPVSNILHEAGASGVVIENPLDLVKIREDQFGEIYELSPDDYPEEGVIIKAYLPVNSFLAESIEAIKEAINQLLLYDIDIGKNEITVSEVNEEDWATAWKKYYKPVKISDRITITPTWEQYEKTNDKELVIELDPGMAFGTGTHPTTVLSIQAIERYIKEGDYVIDVGTGSGVLSIAAAKLGAAKVQAYDLDDVAVKAATMNVEINKTGHIVKVKQNNLLENVADYGNVDVIVANILADVIVRMTDDAFKLLKPGGKIITSGIIHSKKNDVKNALKNSGFQLIEIVELEDWLAIIGEKHA